jgi:four helix bundle protein
MPQSHSFRDLKVWQRAIDLVEDVYLLTKAFPTDERFGLSAQLRRAVVSIPSNIGEGARRKRRKAFLHHLDIALGSQAEVEVQIEIAKRLQFIPEADYARLQRHIEEIGKMLNGLINSLQPEEGW